MGQITGFTAERMLAIENGTVVDGHISGSNLILEKKDGGLIDAGNVRGPQGIAGPPGGIADAPINGTLYLRKDGVWVPALIAPSDGKKYAMKDGAWVNLEHPWKLEFNDIGPTPPAGFLAGDLVPGEHYYVSFTGMGNIVNYNIRFAIAGSAVNNSARLTFPAGLRPAVDHFSIAYFSRTGISNAQAGFSLAAYGANGVVTTPQDVAALMVSESSVGFGDGAVVAEAVATLQVHMSGSFIRSSSDLPSTAVYI